MIIPYIVQKLVYFPIGSIIRFLLHLKVKGRENCKGLAGPLIIAVNHKDFIDGPVLVAAFPFRSKLFPVRSLVIREKYFLPILHFFLKITGGMPVDKAKDGDLEGALKAPLKILKNKGIVVIFPEGRMVREEGVFEKGRRGVAFLALKANTPILPVSIKGTAGASFKNLFLRRNKVVVSIGEPLYLPKSLSYDNKDDLVKGSQLVMDKIKELYCRS